MSCTRHAALAGAAALALLIPGGLARADTRSTTSGVAVHLSDLPSGFKQTMAQFITNAQLATQANFSLSLLSSKGRIIGYESSFQRTGKATNTYTVLADTVTDYKATSGAVWGYGVNVQKISPKAIGSTVLKLATVGVKSSAYTVLEHVGSGVQVTLIAFYDRTFSVVIQLQAPKGVVPKAALLQYARLVDGRIKTS